MHLVHKENEESQAYLEQVDNLEVTDQQVQKETREIEVVLDSRETKERLVKRCYEQLLLP